MVIADRLLMYRAVEAFAAKLLTETFTNFTIRSPPFCPDCLV